MDPRIKSLWIEALRSGRYKQGIQVLRRGDTYCCLGVLCDLHRIECGGEWRPNPERPTSWEYDHLDALPPASVWRWAELGCANPQLMPLLEAGSAAQLNDKGTPFSKIADLIEKEL